MRAPGHARLARFKPTKPEPERSAGLAHDHPAVVEGRTLFPTRVKSAAQSQRFLVSGQNNAKIGRTVEKGPWVGFPVFTLTLEERRTCPSSCAMWRDCYGNAMQWPARWDHADPQFLPLLRAELLTLGRANPKGFVVRLHVLGDFYSAAYVYFWAEMLALIPGLHVYGYTARTVFDAAPESVKIARALQVLTDKLWHRFAIRTSVPASGLAMAAAVATVVDQEEEAKALGAVLCPAQTSKTETCGTCALCWSPTFRDEPIAFLRHGMKRRAANAPAAAPMKPRAEDLAAPEGEYIPMPVRIAAAIEAAAPALFAEHPGGVPIAAVIKAVGANYNQTTVALSLLHQQGRFAWVRGAAAGRYKLLQPAGTPDADHGLTKHQQTVLDVLSRWAVNGVVEINRRALRIETGISMPTLDLCVAALRRKGFTEHAGARGAHALFRVLRPSAVDEPRPVPPPTSGLKPGNTYDRVHAHLMSLADADGVVCVMQGDVASALGIRYNNVGQTFGALRMKYLLEALETGKVGRPGRYRVFATPTLPADRPSLSPPAAPISLEVVVVPPVVAPAAAPPAAAPASKPIRQLPKVEVDPDEPMTCAAPNSLLSLGLGKCKWPMNDPPIGRADLMTFCCAKTVGGDTYCPDHRVIAGGRAPSQSAEKAAEQVEAAARARARASSRHALRAAEERAL